MQIVERKPIPLYEVVCFECGSKLRYQASEVNYCHITCPVCRTLLWAMTINPAGFEDAESPKEEIK
jgi:phage FluMu protein Com